MVAFLLMFGVFGPLFILPKGKQHGSFSISLFTQLYGLNCPPLQETLIEKLEKLNIRRIQLDSNIAV